MAFTNKHTQGNWKVRFMNYQKKDDGRCDFFIEAEEPKNQIGKIEILMEDFGEHSGYPREQKLADAKLISQAPAMRQCVEMFYDYLNQEEENEDKLIMKVVRETLIKAGVEIRDNKKVED